MGVERPIRMWQRRRHITAHSRAAVEIEREHLATDLDVSDWNKGSVSERF